MSSPLHHKGNMHNHTRNTVPDAVKEQLLALEQELDVELLLFNAEGYMGPDADRRADSFWRRHHNAGKPENGIDIGFYAGAVGANYQYVNPFPGEWFTDGAETNVNTPDVIVPGEQTPGQRIRLGDYDIGSFEPGKVRIGIHPSGLRNADRDRLLWEQLLIEPLTLLANPERAAELIAARRERSLEAYTEFMRSRADRILRDERHNITGLEGNLRRYESSYRQTLQALHTSRARVEAMTQISNENLDDVTRRFDELTNHPRLTNYYFAGNALTLFTDDIRLTHPVSGETRWLGQFRIEINLIDQSVRMYNQQTRRRNRDHPHIPDGSPCWGDAYQLVAKLVTEGEFVALFDVLLQFLETFNPRDDWGAYAAWWYDRPDEDPLKQEQPEAEQPEAEQSADETPALAVAA